MFYSIIQVKGQFIVTEDPFGEIQVFTNDFFDYEVQENDLVYLKDGMFHKAEEETLKTQEENYNKMQDLFDK